MLVYKYMDTAKVARMISGHLLASPPKFLNDPWEFRINFESTEPELRRQHAMFYQERRAAQSPLDPNRLPEKPPERDFQEFKANILRPEYREDLTNHYIERMSQLHGIISLSADCASRLMWAHYAESHRGMAIGISIDERDYYGTSPFGLALRVEYSGEPLTLIDTEPENVTKLLCRKHPDWRYEEEWRIFKQLKPTEVDFLPETIRGKPVTLYGVKIRPEHVRHVIFGLGTSEEDKEAMRQWLKTATGAPLPVVTSQATIDPVTHAFVVR